MKRKIPINGHQLYAEMYGPGNGPVIVLLHHGIGAARSWKEQTPALAAAGYQIMIYDRWGHGKSDPRPKLGMPYFKQDLADLQRLLDQLGISQACLVGHSDGGKIALYYAASCPERVRSLLLVATHIYIEPKMDAGIQGVLREYQEDLRFREKMRRVHGAKADALFYGWYHGWRDSGILAWDMRPILADIRCPVLVVQGLEDEHASPRHAEDIAAAIHGAELWLVPQAGHMLPQDLPEVFNPRLLEFLGRTCAIKG